MKWPNTPSHPSTALHTYLDGIPHYHDNISKHLIFDIDNKLIQMSQIALYMVHYHYHLHQHLKCLVIQVKAHARSLLS